MYDLNLTESYYAAQLDAEIRAITVGGLLREITGDRPDAVAMVAIDDLGNCGRESTYGEIFTQSERLGQAPARRFALSERVLVWGPVRRFRWLARSVVGQDGE